MLARLWYRLGGGPWHALIADRAFIVTVLERSLWSMFAVEHNPKWPIQTEPGREVVRLYEWTPSVRSAVLEGMDMCATCREPIRGRVWDTPHGPECSLCIERYAD